MLSSFPKKADESISAAHWEYTIRLFSAGSPCF